jgi:NADH-quinone oxidoreductase subunit L
MLPLPAVQPAMAAYEHAVVYLSVALGLAGLAGAAFFFGGDAHRAKAIAQRFPALHRVLSGKYFVDEAYDALLARPLQWISRYVFLGLGDRILLDGSLHGLAGLARRTAGALARVQTGNLQLYLFLAVVGVLAALWSVRG